MSSNKSLKTKWWVSGWRGGFQLLGIVFGLLLLCTSAFSQGSTGRILGAVFDQSGGTVSGATVSIVDVDRGVTRTLTTDDAGEYNAPNLTPGNYTIRVEAKGFKKLERQSVVLEVGKEIRVDLTVQPGAQEQTVTVTEAVPLVETTNATLGGTLENTEIVDLPLNGRDYQNLLGLRPGVMLQVGGGPWTQATNGVRPDESVWMVDGVINSNFYDGRPIAGMPSPITDGATILPIDSIQEFNLMENPKAEYGWKPGAVVNVGIKSGTNTIHGSGYGFYRSAAWEARNYWNIVPNSDGSCLVGPPAACAQTPAQLKQFGGSVGGPIKKDKLFFFANYEGLRDLIGNAFSTTGGQGVPETGTSNADVNQNMAAAIQALASAGTPRSSISEGLAGCKESGTAPNITATCTGNLFPSNPSNSIGFLSTFPDTNKSDNGVAKIDYHINDKNSLNGVFIIGRYYGVGEDRGFINGIFLNGYPIETYTGSGNWDYTPNSRIVNEFRFGYDRESIDQTSLDANLPNPVKTGSLVPGLPTISIGNPANGGTAFGLFGTWHSRPQHSDGNPYYDTSENFSYLVGKHSLKFGGEFAHVEGDVNIPDYGRGRINFASLEDFFSGTVKPGKPGKGKGGQFLVGNSARVTHSNIIAGFAQDDWRISQKFTLNWGLRYSYSSPLKEAHNLWANFDPTSQTGLVQEGTAGHDTLWHPDRADFSPRAGFAWDMTGKGTTVVRGGFSVIYSTPVLIEWQNQNQFQQAGGSSVSLGADPTGADLYANGILVFAGSPNGTAVKAAKFDATQMCYDPMVSVCPTGQTTVFPAIKLACGDGSTLVPSGLPGPGQCNLMAVDPNLKTPYIVNFSLSVTHAFTPNLSLEVGYVGDHGARLTGFTDINQCAPNNQQTGGNCVLPFASKFPWFGYINEMTNDTRSNYHSMQATLTKRMSRGLSAVIGYTYAHGLDNGSLNRFGLIPQNAYDPGAEYGSGDFDVRHRLTITGTYNIPGKKGFVQLLEGWQINAIATIQSPQPWITNDYNAGSYKCKFCGAPLMPGPVSMSNPGTAIDYSGGGFSGTGDNADRWDFFGNPSDFKGTQTSIPYCSGFTVNFDGSVNSGGASCSITSGVTTVSFPAPNSSTYISNCAAKTPDPTTLAVGGCFANNGSVMLPPKGGTFGTMGRNIFRDSGYKNLDFSVFKTFTWKERYTAQFRAEVFNILNHPVFENPYGASNGSSGGNNDPSSPSAFGAAIGTPDVVAGNPLVGSGDSRNIQLGLKLTF